MMQHRKRLLQRIAPPQKPFDKELEITKIETVKEAFLSYFKIGSSILTGGLTALVILIITLYFSHTLDLVTAIIEAILVGVVMGTAFLVNNRRYKRFLQRYNSWLTKIENKTPLPSVFEMTNEV